MTAEQLDENFDKGEEVILPYWSRRITEEHRLVYRPIESGILIVQLRYHYKK